MQLECSNTLTATNSVRTTGYKEAREKKGAVIQTINTFTIAVTK